jgi:hypothetical protein
VESLRSRLGFEIIKLMMTMIVFFVFSVIAQFSFEQAGFVNIDNSDLPPITTKCPFDEPSSKELTAYLNSAYKLTEEKRFNEAVACMTTGVKKFPKAAKFYQVRWRDLSSIMRRVRSQGVSIWIKFVRTTVT